MCCVVKSVSKFSLYLQKCYNTNINNLSKADIDSTVSSYNLHAKNILTAIQADIFK